MASSSPPARLLIYLIFCLSGFSALVYEILWTKQLSLTFGTTMLAVSTVAATFMGGLALGSFLLGKKADRSPNLLRLYALLEIGIALAAFFFAPALGLATNIYIALSQLFPDHPTLAAGCNFLFSALLLLPPTIFMGGTFPVMCRLFAQKQLGGEVGRLYALNTLGATVGTFVSGFFLIPRLGISGTAFVAIGINLAVAAVASSLSGQERAPLKDQEPEQSIGRFSTRGRRYPVACAALLGCFALAYEILWTRVLLLFLGSTTYAFATILSVFLVGIALGGAGSVRLIRKNPDPHPLFARLILCMGLFVLATAPFYDRLAFLFQAVHEIAAGRWWLLAMFSFAAVSVVMLIPAILSGALLPLAANILAPGRSHAGEGVGIIVFWNTFGAVAGSLLAGFTLIPLLGLQKSFQFIAFLNILLAGGTFIIQQKKFHWGFPVPALLILGLLLALNPFRWDPELMNSGVYVYSNIISDAGGLRQRLANHKTLETFEGLDATVAVHEIPAQDIRILTINGKIDAGSGIDMETQLLLGHLPLLVHPDPQKVLVIGLGSGITLSAVTEHPVDAIDCVEISRAVVQAVHYFHRENRNALDDPRVHLNIQDARNYLLTRPQAYDIITSEPSNPWQAGNANLFTAEFYELVSDRLRDGGIFCQWIPLYDTTTDNLRTVCRTFLNHFPSAMAFLASDSYDLLLVGAQKPLQLDYLTMVGRMSDPRIRSSLMRVGLLTAGDLIGRHYLFSQEALTLFAGKATLNTDDRPILEYSYQDIFIPQLRNQNLAALNKAMGHELLPLANVGTSPAQKSTALSDLGKGFIKGGRVEIGRYFLQLASGQEGSSRQAPGRD